ncbi:hypothetical protein ACFXKD_22185 [Nocardiopsis aegyptia]|uniref:hypothetical protein n=1 Tax=Nocardiopsis aegyptia TaxID=220378 RepID=UPI00366D2993
MSTATNTARRPRGTGRPTLPVRLRRAVLTVHVISSVGLLGEVWVLVVLTTVAARDGDTEFARTAYRLLSVLVFAGGIPLSLTALATGLVLALGTRWGLFRYVWVFAKLVALVGVIAIGAALFAPEELAVADGLTASRQWGQTAAVTAQAVLLVTATVLSVHKPRWRIGSGAR